MLADDVETHLHRCVEVGRAPVTRELRIEHVAEPVQNDGSANLPEDGAIDAPVVGGPPSSPRQRPARHQNHACTLALDIAHLLFVAALDRVEGHTHVGREMVGAGAARNQAVHRPCFGDGASDELARDGPVEARAALRGVHRLGDAKAERPEVTPVGERRVPVQLRVRVRIAHDVRRGVGHTGPDRSGGRGPHARFPHRVGRERAVSARQLDCPHPLPPSPFRRGGTSIQRRSAHDCMPNSAS